MYSTDSSTCCRVCGVLFLSQLGEAIGSMLGWATHKTASGLEAASTTVTPAGVDVGRGPEPGHSAVDRHQEAGEDVRGWINDREAMIRGHHDNTHIATGQAILDAIFGCHACP